MRIVLRLNLNYRVLMKRKRIRHICLQHVLLVALNVLSTSTTACMSTAVTNTICAL